MICIKCKSLIEDDSIFCRFCGKKQTIKRIKRVRGNGEGTIEKTANGNYKAIVNIGCYRDENGNRHYKHVTKTCKTHREAVEQLTLLKNSPKKKEKQDITFKALYDKWLPTHQASKSTLDCYKAAIKYFEPVWYLPMSVIDIDDLQECMDDCEKGKRTQQNMKAVCGLVYKYGIPRQAVPENLNLAPFLKVNGDAPAHRESFSDEQIESIKNVKDVYGSDMVYALIYLGFRPSEFLSLTKEQYDEKHQAFTGGSKTAAGTNRTVTISPKIQDIISKYASRTQSGAIFRDEKDKAYSLKDWTESVFYATLNAAEIENPIIDTSGDKRHKYTPHSCRHTFSTLMKRVNGADKDKLELIGHTSTEMLRYYQDINWDDLRKITDNI